jgi:PAS domain S-box-containing protein
VVMQDRDPSASARLAEGDPHALDACPDTMTVVRADGTIGLCSSAVSDLLGFEPGELLGRRVCEMLHPDELRALVSVFGRCQTPGHRGCEVHRLRRSDGSYVWVESTAVGLALPGSAEGGPVLFASRDVSERLAVEQRVLALNQVWTEVYDAMHEGVVVIDRDGLVTSANRAAGEFLLVDPQRLLGALGRAQVVVIDENGHPMPPERLPSTRARRTGTIQEEAVAYRRADGTVVWLNGRAIPIQRPGEPRPGLVALLLEDAAGPRLRGEAAPHGQLVDAARAVLTPRELQVLRLLADGLDVRGVAGELGISLHTTRGHVKAVMNKLDARTQLQAVVVGLRTGLLQMP